MRRRTRESDNGEQAAGAEAPGTAGAPSGDGAGDTEAARLLAERIERAEELAASGNAAGAVDAFTSVTSHHPDSVRALLGLGSALAAQGKFDAAEKELRRALKLAPDLPEVHHHLGATLYKRGVYAAAATTLRRAVELDPDASASYVILGEALNQMAESDAAIEVLEQALKLHESPKAYYAMGIAYDRKGNHDRAAEMYRLSREVGGK